MKRFNKQRAKNSRNQRKYSALRQAWISLYWKLPHLRQCPFLLKWKGLLILPKFLKKILKKTRRNPSEIKKRLEWKSSIKSFESFRREFRNSLEKRIMKHITISGLHIKK